MRNRFGFLAALVLLGCAFQGCFVENGYFTECESRYTCDYVCQDYSYVEDVCDFWSCWSETVVVRDCGDVCSSYDVCYSVECRHDRDCGPGESCSNGECYYRGTGSSQLCESCSVSGDCAGSNSACVELGSGEQVCLMGCSAPSDCPYGYECQAVGDKNSGQSVQQCVPNNESCDASYCRNDVDCDENASCVNNRCVLDMTNLNECQSNYECEKNYGEYGLCLKSVDSNNNPISYCTLSCYSDSGCDKGYACYLQRPNDLESGACYRANEKSCLYDSDCSDNMACNNGKCMKRCASNSDCASPSNGFSCVSGVCKFYM